MGLARGDDLDRVEILLQLLLAFGLARLLGRAGEAIGLPSVIGELTAGAVLGPQLLGMLHANELFDALAELGVILLLFMAGLETHVRQLLAVRRAATGVAVFGAALPFGAGVLTAWALDYGLVESLFVATALMATSVGITVRVLRDMGVGENKSVRIILGAAVLDDILGLLVLVVVTALALGRTNYLEITLLTVEAVTYIVFVSLMGPWAVSRFSTLLRRLPKNVLFELSVVQMLALSLLAEYIGLAAIIGAFLAGLVVADLKEHTELEQQFQPLAWFFVPFFFVLMGTYIDFGAFTEPLVLIATVSFTVVAITTKYFGALLGARHEGRQTAREVAVGMIPRGEVGIVVAGVALSTGVVGDDVYSAVVAMVVLTTFIAPFLMKATFRTRAAPPVAGR
jgi:Kef-type K+ transport system membrane component KefB